MFRTIFKLLTFCWLTFFPFTGILYLLYIDSPEKFPMLAFHKAAILFAELLSAFIAYAAYLSFKNSRSDFLRYVSLGYIGFVTIYAFHGILTDHSTHNLAQFIIFGPISRLIMSGYLFFGLSRLQVLPEEAVTTPKNLFWPHFLLFFGIVAFAAIYTHTSGSVPLIHIKYIELAAILISLCSIGKIVLLPARSYIMKFHLAAQFLFVQASTAFLLTTPWTSLWWFAHLISGTGFLLLGYAIVVSYEKTNSLAVVYDETILHNLLNRIIDNSPIGILVADAALSSVRSNKELSRILKSDKHRIDPRSLFTSMKLDATALASLHAGNVVECSFQVTSGECKQYLEAKVTMITDKHADCYLVILADVTEKHLASERVNYLAKHDALTGLANRTLFHERLFEELAKPDGTPCALLFIDLDGFKKINDTYGHDAGDIVLKTVAQRLNACIGKTNTIARMGGDEFTIILTDVTSRCEIQTIAETIIEALAKPIALTGKQVAVTSSIGISIAPLDGTEADILVTKADSAMYTAKHNGKNGYSFHQSSGEAY
ncbi:diguanylate cyclase (GGDEF)-like protein [Anaerospora hongkongensis]|uniref:Diguanylate cyclase (GGDEF)-like protein n=1 Tax=Anaerospora hongkongensis TaxID=244830 RepID=A0A4R1Q699_9FIRM|nr:GGDEF domain-containing protein [Anaerospora hongkongensis]TCL36768.1 diguanylate cyclase (GGDEF)-like protein [Anaerospora hongkongensis]